jgi:hypothetical protein
MFGFVLDYIPGKLAIWDEITIRSKSFWIRY